MDYFLAIATLVFCSFLPLLELRFSIPLGFFATLHGVHIDWWWVVPIFIIAKVALGLAAFEILSPILDFLRKRWSWFLEPLWPTVDQPKQTP